MFAKYWLGASAFIIAVLTGVAAYLKIQVQGKEIELKNIEKDSAKAAVESLADAQKADQDALNKQQRRSTDEINNAKSGNRDYFE